MPLRHALALLALVVAPLIVIGWLGTAAVRRQQRQAVEQLRGLRLERLTETTTDLHRVIERYAESLGSELQAAGRDPAALRELRRSQPSIRSVLAVDSDGNLVEPPAPPPENRSAVAWHGALGELARRRPVFVQPEPQQAALPMPPLEWTGDGTSLPETASAAERRAAGQSFAARDAYDANVLARPVAAVVQQNAMPAQHDTPLTAAPPQWQTWYYDNGLQLVLWASWSDQTATGLVLERGRWMADLIAALPETGQTARLEKAARSGDGFRSNTGVSFAHYVLRDSEGQVIYRWGQMGKDDQPVETLAEVSLLPPLAGWNLAYEGQPLTVAWWEEIGVVSLLASLIAVVISLVLLGIYVHTSFRRQMLLAQQRVDFASHVSHELRTPLTNIRLYAELARRDLTQWIRSGHGKPDGSDDAPAGSSGSPEQTQVENATEGGVSTEPSTASTADLASRLDHRIQIIEDETQRLSRLVTGVLDLVSSNRRGERLRYSSASIDEIIGQVLASFRPALDPSVWEVDLDLNAQQPVSVDVDLVELVLVNLISNVEKYAAAGCYLGIRSDQSDRRTVIDVHDRGPGVQRGSAKKIFRPFVRIDDSLVAPAGTGLGLAIARGAARRLGGDLTLEPCTTGACFRFTLQHGPEEPGETPPPNHPSYS